MTFVTKSTKDLQKNGPTKTMLYAHHGFGKTTQMRFYQKMFGKGLIISGESGLKSIEDCDIDYIPFTSWDGRHDPENGVFSFRGTVGMIMSESFRKQGYKWIGLDSLTEVADRLLEHIEKAMDGDDKKYNGFDVWNEYSSSLIGALKWIRDLPLHVYVSCLAKEEEDPNGMLHHWPMIKGKAAAKQVPAVFDHVFCGQRVTSKTDDGEVVVTRRIITDEAFGWHGKSRDPLHRLKVVEETGDITELLHRLSLTEKEYAAWLETTKTENA